MWGGWSVEVSFTKDGLVDVERASNALGELAGLLASGGNLSVSFQTMDGVARNFGLIGEDPNDAPGVDDIPPLGCVDVVQDSAKETRYDLDRSGPCDLGFGVMEGTHHDSSPERCEVVGPDPFSKKRPYRDDVGPERRSIPVFSTVGSTVSRSRTSTVRADVKGAADGGVVVVRSDIGTERAGGVFGEDSGEVAGREHGE